MVQYNARIKQPRSSIHTRPVFTHTPAKQRDIFVPGSCLNHSFIWKFLNVDALQWLYSLWPCLINVILFLSLLLMLLRLSPLAARVKLPVVMPNNLDNAARYSRKMKPKEPCSWSLSAIIKRPKKQKNKTFKRWRIFGCPDEPGACCTFMAAAALRFLSSFHRFVRMSSAHVNNVETLAEGQWLTMQRVGNE